MPTDIPAIQSAAKQTGRTGVLPTLPAGSRLESIQALKATIAARAALAAFAQALKQTAMGDAAGSAFALMDAVGAAQLEGEPLDLLEALRASEPASSRLQSHLNARHQAHARLLDEPVGSTLALELASALHNKPVSVRRGAALESDSGSTSPYYSRLSPPRGAERLQALLEDWQGFVQQDAGDLDPLLMAAAAHGQWIALRPFTHANILTGQLLTALLLCEEDLLPSPSLPLALYFSRHADAHWQQLYVAMAHGDHTCWIEFFMTAVTESAVKATGILMQWEKLAMEQAKIMNISLPKPPDAALIAVCTRPSFGMADLAQAGLSRRQTASSWMQKLMAEGLLSEMKLGKEKRFVNDAVIRLLAAD